jgi:dual specificity phosphatase 12
LQLEHMLDHGQLGPPTPVDSRRPSMNDVKPRRLSMPDQLGGDLSKPLMIRRGSSRGSCGETKARLLAFDGLASFGRGMSESLLMSALEVEDDQEIEKEKKPDPPGVNGLVHPNTLSTQLHANPKLAALRTSTGLPKSTTPSPTLASAPPILADQRCSGYFVEAVCPYRPFRVLKSFVS